MLSLYKNKSSDVYSKKFEVFPPLQENINKEHGEKVVCVYSIHKHYIQCTEHSCQNLARNEQMDCVCVKRHSICYFLTMLIN